MACRWVFRFCNVKRKTYWRRLLVLCLALLIGRLISYRDSLIGEMSHNTLDAKRYYLRVPIAAKQQLDIEEPVKEYSEILNPNSSHSKPPATENDKASTEKPKPPSNEDSKAPTEKPKTLSNEDHKAPTGKPKPPSNEDHKAPTEKPKPPSNEDHRAPTEKPKPPSNEDHKAPTEKPKPPSNKDHKAPTEKPKLPSNEDLKAATEIPKPLSNEDSKAPTEKPKPLSTKDSKASTEKPKLQATEDNKALVKNPGSLSNEDHKAPTEKPKSPSTKALPKKSKPSAIEPASATPKPPASEPPKKPHTTPKAIRATTFSFLGNEYSTDDLHSHSKCPNNTRDKLKASFSKHFMESVPLFQWKKHATKSEYARLSRYHGTYGWMNISWDVLKETLELLNSTANGYMFDTPDHRPTCIRCAVVGNGGILNGSRKGKEIDDHDYVFRVNGAVIRGFEEDVGNKTSFYFASIQTFMDSLMAYYYRGFKHVPGTEKTRFLLLPDDIRNYLMVTAAIKKKLVSEGKDKGKNPTRYFGKNLTAERFKILHPDFLRYLANTFLWDPILRTKDRKIYRPSTGAVVLMAAIHACDQQPQLPNGDEALAGSAQSRRHPALHQGLRATQPATQRAPTPPCCRP